MARDPDEIAIERYRYLLRTAPPQDIERAHAEAFSKLTPEQRARVLEGLAVVTPEPELRAAGNDPERLARLATRAEIREPGTMERVFAQVPARGGFIGGLGFGGTFLSTLAGAFVGTMIAQSLFGSFGYPPGDPAGGDAGAGGDASTANDGGTNDADSANGHSDGGSWDGTDDGGTDFGGDGGDMGDMGGDFGDMGGF
jgi:hypothetical protein